VFTRLHDDMVQVTEEQMAELAETCSDKTTTRKRAADTTPDMRRADLERADLERADLERADLERADLERADLERADLQRSDLQRSDHDKLNSARFALLHIMFQLQSQHSLSKDIGFVYTLASELSNISNSAVSFADMESGRNDAHAHMSTSDGSLKDGVRVAIIVANDLLNRALDCKSAEIAFAANAALCMLFNWTAQQMQQMQTIQPVQRVQRVQSAKNARLSTPASMPGGTNIFTTPRSVHAGAGGSGNVVRSELAGVLADPQGAGGSTA
jgi:hypothetical protein